MRTNLITRLKEEWNNLDPVDPLRGLIADAIDALAEAQPSKPLTPREVELLDGMIEVQLDHAKRCDSIGNRPMAEKQKAWDMERVELLRKLKAAHGITGDK